jgi:hypothetical protein
MSTAHDPGSTTLLPLALAGLLLALVAPAGRVLAERLSPGRRGMLSGVLLFMVFKTLAERPDRAFLYFNF